MHLRPGWIPVLNKLSWIFATHENSKVRIPAKSIKIAEQANKITENKNPKTLDILAAAYTEAGRFKDAVQAAKLAITLAENNKQKNSWEKSNIA